MNILSLDLATKVTGFCIFKDDEMKHYGKIEVPNFNLPTKPEIMRARIIYILAEVKKIIKEHKIKLIIAEDVPISSASPNLDVAKYLCVLQGAILSTKIPMITYKPTEWRTIMQLQKTRFVCKKCGATFEDNSSLENPICGECGNDKKTTFSRTALNKREQCKKRAVEKIKELYNVEVTDDEAEAILIGLAYQKNIGG